MWSKSKVLKAMGSLWGILASIQYRVSSEGSLDTKVVQACSARLPWSYSLYWFLSENYSDSHYRTDFVLIGREESGFCDPWTGMKTPQRKSHSSGWPRRRTLASTLCITPLYAPSPLTVPDSPPPSAHCLTSAASPLLQSPGNSITNSLLLYPPLSY